MHTITIKEHITRNDSIPLENKACTTLTENFPSTDASNILAEISH